MMPDLGNNGAYRRDDPALAAGLWAKVSASVPRMFRGCQAVGLSERFRLYRCDVGERFAPPIAKSRAPRECSSSKFSASPQSVRWRRLK